MQKRSSVEKIWFFQFSQYFNLFSVYYPLNDHQYSFISKPIFKEHIFLLFNFRFFMFFLFEPIDAVLKIILCQNDLNCKEWFFLLLTF